MIRYMARTDFSSLDCSVAQCLASVGDTWSFLIIRDAMFGVRRFSDFERSLNIAKNILRNRLASLVEEDILEKVDVGEHGPRYEYVLSEKGRDLFPVIIALRQWADRWVDPTERQALVMKDKAKGEPIPYMAVRDTEGNALDLSSVTAELPADMMTMLRSRLDKKG